ncbi:guanylate kinase [Burkholderia oklahomensis]|uniref:guanylate kinase n=1 Tax=Burkholderia oklahomensis TaxID=342113 RepID=UPI00016A7C3E|nr:guanylate kinase [Burkholderia oklahomensis]AJX32136.1 guanylate kinase [Burkholderia oklahomensis C6786]AOI45212.1 guanylate kinase [Burkholderia oklahomensis C6786]KUY59515.1 guanylate kinase [Burkholderia oklahomensis C6786]MBI0358727.1 guanylate kinase [Burkholderia oklahomensis]MDN7672236.1 guanylate kinase [Burkholderia oklahomensis]
MTDSNRDGAAAHTLHAGVYPGNLFMVVAPSGAGKSTLVNALLSKDSEICLSISYTTRKPRPGEQDGEHYHFTTVEDFRERHARHEFLESAEVHGNYYGTSRVWIEEQMKNGHDVLLEIDWQGAQQVKKQFRNAVGIFILPPSLVALEERLKKRGKDEPNVITRRLLAAGGEIAHAAEAEYVVINETFEHALAELECIVAATRLRFTSQYARHAELFVELGIHLPHAE